MGNGTTRTAWTAWLLGWFGKLALAMLNGTLRAVATQPLGRDRRAGARFTTARTRAREQARRVRAATSTSPAAWRRAEQQAEREEAAHVKAECGLRQTVRAAAAGPGEDRCRGQAGREVSDVDLGPDLSAEDVALGYKNLLEAERGFRDLKSTIELRPVFHRLEPRIRAHVLLCWLALLLIRIAERRIGQTWRRIARELERLHAITLLGPAGTVVQTTEPATAQSGILTALAHLRCRAASGTRCATGLEPDGLWAETIRATAAQLVDWRRWCSANAAHSNRRRSPALGVAAHDVQPVVARRCTHAPANSLRTAVCPAKWPAAPM